jgi:hypothetical protein
LSSYAGAGPRGEQRAHPGKTADDSSTHGVEHLIRHSWTIFIDISAECDRIGHLLPTWVIYLLNNNALIAQGPNPMAEAIVPEGKTMFIANCTGST